MKVEVKVANIVKQEEYTKVLEEIKSRAMKLKASNSIMQDQLRLKAVI